MKNEGKNLKGKIDAFLIGFAVTIIIASLISLLYIAYGAMENTISGNAFNLVNLQKMKDETIIISILEKEYFFNFRHIGEIIGKYSFYDLFIPAQIRAALSICKTASDSVVNLLQWLF